MSASSCTACDLHTYARCVGVKPRYSRTPTEDQPYYEVVFVTDAPSQEDESRGSILRGDDGGLLDMALKRFGIHDYAMTSVVRCRPADDKKPRAGEAKTCRELYLFKALERWKPKVVVPLGAVALKYVAGLDKITDVAGRCLEIPGRPWKVFPIVAPSAALRYPERFEQAFEAQMRALGRFVRGDKTAPVTYERVTVADGIARIKAMAATPDKPYGFDIETAPTQEGWNLGLNPRFNRLLTVSFATETGKAFWLEWPEKGPQAGELREAVYELLRSGRPMVAHNVPMEVKHLLWHVVRPVVGIEEARAFTWKVEDSLLYYYLLHEAAQGSYGLDRVRQSVVPDMAEYDAKVNKQISDGKSHHELDLEELGYYNAGDADATLRIANVLRPRIAESRDLTQVWEKILAPAVFPVAWAELHGRKIDYDAYARLRKEFKKTKKKAMAVLRDHWAVKKYAAEHGIKVSEWNPGSSKQVATIVFDYLGYSPLGATESGDPSTAAKYLEPYAGKSRFIKNLLAWKEAQTLDNVYLVKYAEKAAPDGFLYGGYILFGACTGRLSSTKPNLQNFAPILRQIIVSRYPNGVIVEADYSQIELRLMAMESKCKPLLEAYANGIDVHALTATKVCSKLFQRDVTMDEVLEQHAKAEASKGSIPSWRQEYGKRPNFALLYNAQPKRFAAEFHVSLKEATIIHAAFHEAYPEIGAYYEQSCEIARTKGVMTSAFGRKRRLPQAKGEWREYSPQWWEQLAAFREANNFRIQSLANDLNTRAATRVHKKLAAEKSKILLLGFTHDSATYDVPPEEATPERLAAFVALLRRSMVEVTLKMHPWITVPIDIDVKAGPSWGTLAKIKKAA